MTGQHRTGRARRRAHAVAAALFALPLLTGAAVRAQPVNVPVVLPLTGGGSFGGKGYQADLVAMERNLPGLSAILHMTFHDDQTSPQQAVQVMGQILPAHPPVILGSGQVGICNAMAPFTTQAGPVQFCLSPSFRPKPGSFGFVAGVDTTIQIATLVNFMRQKGWTRIAELNSTDATGQNGAQDLDAALAAPQNHGLKLVSRAHFAPNDLSVTAQLEQIRAAGAQALFSWTTGTPLATVFKGMVQLGMTIPVATTAGNMTFEEMQAFTAFLPKQMLIASALFPPHDGVLTLDPRVEQEQHRMYAALAKSGLKTDVSAEAWDAALIVMAAVRALGPHPTAQAVRGYIAGLTDFPGSSGIYNFVAYPQRGLGPDSATVVTYDPAHPAWTWLSRPGGAPLSR